ncbi:hypothetical protein COLO4_01151 [Corchorus olitorius]|uniref:Uncharacterized protein n=1 Tax=Corchorus olitorius TaxID=93759 RepID=A0A1R3L2W8_9ROSI|nr:hypothetical protein COLO4_03225 [Corchorus olitorius]OMP13686.1 hypothetical protein COLO4_01151 [Corchorus olitorius]
MPIPVSDRWKYGYQTEELAPTYDIIQVTIEK